MILLSHTKSYQEEALVEQEDIQVVVEVEVQVVQAVEVEVPEAVVVVAKWLEVVVEEAEEDYQVMWLLWWRSLCLFDLKL